jgi:hypothetical protein
MEQLQTLIVDPCMFLRRVKRELVPAQSNQLATAMFGGYAIWIVGKQGSSSCYVKRLQWNQLDSNSTTL